MGEGTLSRMHKWVGWQLRTEFIVCTILTLVRIDPSPVLPLPSAQAGNPVLCDALCALDSFLLTLPLFTLAALAVHVLTRFPSPQIGKVSAHQQKKNAPCLHNKQSPVSYYS